MAECNQLGFELPGFSGRKIEGNFGGGNLSSDGGLVLLRQVDRFMGLTKELARRLPDRRDPDKIEHSLESMLRQRIYGLALGYEDLNDQDSLRKDLLWQSAAERTEELASSSTLCRLENRAGRKEAWMMHEVFIEKFLSSFQSAPRELILDFDCTDDRVHGLQEGRHFHGYYYDFCFLPLYVFCGEQLLVSYLRESNIDSAKHAWAVLALLVKALRKRWPGVKIILRADSGFCRWKMLRWCERVGVNYIVGLAKNERLNTLSAKMQKRAERKHRRSGLKVRLFSQFQYKAKTWDKKRRVIAKAEYSDRGANPRYVLTNLEGRSQRLYDEIYCARGEMENRIKEQQLGLFSDRTSCHAWWANQFRLLLSSAAYALLETLRRIGLRGSEWARAQVETIRLRLLKIGAVITRNTRRIRLWLSSSFALQELFCSCLERFSG
jgi:hypothetical protein